MKYCDFLGDITIQAPKRNWSRGRIMAVANPGRGRRSALNSNCIRLVSLIAFVVSVNLHRRHLTSSHRAGIATEVRPMLEEEAKERQKEHGGTAPGKPAENTGGNNSTSDDGKSRDAAAALLNTNPRYVSDAKRLKADAPEEFERVRRGEQSIGQAIAVADNHRAMETGENEWYTPGEYIEAAREVLGRIDLNPASSEHARHSVKSCRAYTQKSAIR